MGVRDISLILILVLTILLIILVKLFFKDSLAIQIVYFLNLTAIFVLFLYYLLNKQNSFCKKWLFAVLVSALFIKIILMIVMHQAITMPDEITGYDQLSWRQTKSWQGEYTQKMDDNPCAGGTISTNKCIAGSSTYYYYLIAVIYYVFGHAIMIAKLFNIFFSILSGLFIYFIVQELFKNERISRISLIAVLFFPSINFWTLPLLRESILLFLITASFFLFIKLIKAFKFTYFVFLLVCFDALWNLRSYILAILICVFALGAISKILDKMKVLKISIIALMIILFLICAGMFIDHNSRDWIDSKFKRLDVQRESSEHGNFAFLVGEDISTFQNVLIFLPKGLVYFFFSPFFWQMPGITKLIILPSIVLSYFILPFIVWGVVIIYKNRKMADCFSLLMFCILVILLYSLMDGNIWLLDRHKIQAIYFLLIFGAVGLNQLLLLLYKIF